MRNCFVPLLAAAALCACTSENELVHVKTSSEYVENPKCWGGDTRVRQGYMILLRQDEPYAYLLSQNCVVGRLVGQGAVIEHLAILKIEGSSKPVEDELGIKRSLGAKFLTSREVPPLEAPVYEVQFSLEELESDGFTYFKLLEIEVLDRSPKTFEDLLIQ